MRCRATTTREASTALQDARADPLTRVMARFDPFCLLLLEGLRASLENRFTFCFICLFEGLPLRLSKTKAFEGLLLRCRTKRWQPWISQGNPLGDWTVLRGSQQANQFCFSVCFVLFLFFKGEAVLYFLTLPHKGAKGTRFGGKCSTSANKRQHGYPKT